MVPYTRDKNINSPRESGRGGYLGLIFAGDMPLASQNPYPIMVYSVAIIIFIDPILVTLGTK